MSLASFWKRIVGFFEGAKVVASEILVKVFGAQAAQDFAVAADKVLQSELGKIALSVVNGLESLAPALSSGEKASQAAAAIGAQAKASGIEASNSLINLLIELCVNGLNGHFHQQ